MTIEGEIGGAASESEVSLSQGFSAGFPSRTPTTEVGEGSGMAFSAHVLVYHLTFVLTTISTCD